MWSLHAAEQQLRRLAGGCRAGGLGAGAAPWELRSRSAADALRRSLEFTEDDVLRVPQRAVLLADISGLRLEELKGREGSSPAGSS